ncbi:hypothetical protein [Streptomyces sp. AK02-04a]|uniref:hypothetical protein n=1 Tax=Streptomyces sp. AK02-04a TaxID=3028649 RepID=UPI0029B6DAC2|nr:hypothetical protein [Streptomyces sp. AK02-04a]MDX3760781.1 hypothetical protein [Streptomyces sp. AK02-04a]
MSTAPREYRAGQHRLRTPGRVQDGAFAEAEVGTDAQEQQRGAGRRGGGGESHAEIAGRPPPRSSRQVGVQVVRSRIRVGLIVLVGLIA